MEMPSDCSRCGGIFELNDMYASDYENQITASRMECAPCHRKAEQDAEESSKCASWACPNTPGCAHPSFLHDDSGDLEDPRPLCCIDGCPCGRPDPAEEQEETR